MRLHDCRRLMFMLALMLVVSLDLSSAEYNITDILGLIGPRSEVDVVGLLDRSQGVGQHNFYYFVLPFFSLLLRQYTAVHADFARTAVITFAKHATVAYDTISGSDAAVSKCELFEGSPALWDRVKFNSDPTVIVGTHIRQALQLAIGILDRGRANRPNAAQVIVIISDGDHANTEDPYNQRRILVNHGVQIFTIGVGSWLRIGELRNLASRPGYYGDRKEWEDMLDGVPSTILPGTKPLLAALGARYCGNNTCSKDGSRCYCDVDTVDQVCLCTPGYHLPTQDASAVCQPCPKNTFKDTPGSGPCILCSLDRGTLRNGSVSRRDCLCVNTSCAPGTVFDQRDRGLLCGPP